MDILKAILFGVVEGITEWLPVSSTGHMILLNEFIKMKTSEEFWNVFLVVIQLGAILAVVLLYWNRIWPVRKKTMTDRHTGKRVQQLMLDRRILDTWGKALVACVPAAVVGVAADDWLDRHLYNWVCVSIMLILVGIAFIMIERRNRSEMPVSRNLREISYRQAVGIGLFQLIAAVFPGTSRSGATILGGLLLGVSRKAAADFTFILAIPVMAGASLLKLVKHGLHFSGLELTILVLGMVVAFLVSVVIIRLLMGYIKKHNFVVFGWYRIALGLMVILYFGLIRR